MCADGKLEAAGAGQSGGGCATGGGGSPRRGSAREDTGGTR